MLNYGNDLKKEYSGTVDQKEAMTWFQKVGDLLKSSWNI
jgi:hypothetical protein